MNRFCVVLGVLGVAPLLISQEEKVDAFSPYVDSNGAIRLPTEYRENWTHMGTYMVLNESAAGHGLHAVYTQRANIDAYNQTGEWPDGTTIVKEVRHTRGATMTTGDAHWGADMDVWFVMVKDREGRYPKNPLWGDGWGWALFRGADPNKQVATSYKSDCLTCHIPAKANDWVYTEGYPSLRKIARANPAGTPANAVNTSPSGMEQRASGASWQKGAQTFAVSCKFCHNADSTERKIGPGLAGVSAGKLPGGGDASEANISKKIAEGGNGMPAFGSKLSSAEIADLVAYLKTL